MITMVKKRLENGEPCAKCAQAEALLKKRGHWDRIDEVVWAVEGEPESPGMKLGARLGIEVAPFFVVNDAGQERVYKSVLQFVKKELAGEAGPSARKSEPDIDVEATAADLAERSPSEIVEWSLERFGADCGIAFSGAEDVVLIDLATKTGLPFSVFSLDTGRLHPETYRFIDKVREHYGVEIRTMFPAAEAVEALVREKGLFSFYDDGHGECCGIRKVEPLRRALKSYRAWVTGLRQDQSPATRSDIPAVEVDDSHEGAAGLLFKVNPVARWTSAQVWQYIREHDVPYNPLHEQGYTSIGCAPCTRATLPGEHERAGRWWWEEATKRECGLHTGK